MTESTFPARHLSLYNLAPKKRGGEKTIEEEKIEEKELEGREVWRKRGG